MSQAATWQIGADPSGVSYRQADNDRVKAVASHHKGSAAPSYKETGYTWIDDSVSPWLLKVYDGADWITIGSINSTTNQFTPYLSGAAIALAQATTSAQGIVELATDAETLALADTVRAITPSNLSALAASVTQRGIAELATTAETQTGSDTGRVVTPAGAAGTFVAQGRHTANMPASGMAPRNTNGATPYTAELATNKQIIRGLSFSNSVQQYAQFYLRVPKGSSAASFIARFEWTAPSGSGTVLWGIQALAVSDDDAMDAAWGTAQETTDTLGSTNDFMSSAETAAVTPSGSPATQDLWLIQVYRNAGTLAAAAILLGVQIFLTVNAKDDA